MAPIAYIVAERRPWTGDPDWIIGDDWSRACTSLADAEEEAARWRADGQGLSEDVAVLALVLVLGGAA